ncbi:hypothetical protein D1872_292280 [compost metagenome]
MLLAFHLPFNGLFLQLPHLYLVHAELLFQLGHLCMQFVHFPLLHSDGCLKLIL